MASGNLPALSLDANSVGSCTVAVSELLDRRCVLAFSAAVGAGGSRMSADTPECAPCPHPALAFRLQFLAQRRLDVVASANPAWLSAVHAESDLRIMRPFRLGDVITTQGQLIARRQVKPGVLNVERYRMWDAQGNVCAELDYHLIFRGATLTGPERVIAPLPPAPIAVAANPSTPSADGSSPSAVVSGAARVIDMRLVPREALHVYTACSGIFADIHTSRGAARAAGFDDIILHGSATKAFALSAIIDTLLDGDATRVRRLRGRLKAAIPADTSFSVLLTGVGRLECMDDDIAQKVFWFEVRNHAGEIAIANGCVVAAQRGGER